MAEYRRNRDRTPPKRGAEQQIVEGILKGLWWAISLPFRKGSTQKATSSTSRALPANSAQELAAYWQTAIEDRPGQGSDVSPAILEADKLLDMAFKEMGFQGATMGERLREAAVFYPADLYDRIWKAHKLRNHVAHEMGAYIPPQEGKIALEAFRDALRVLGVRI